MKYGKMEWGQMEAVVNKLGGLDGVERFLNNEFEIVERQKQTPAQKPIPSILEFIGMVAVSATTSKFVAKEKFVRDTGDKARVKISYLGDNFTAWFLKGDGKTEESMTEQTLRYAKLRKASKDIPIVNELGGEEKSETTLSEMFSLMGKQGKGEAGVLLNNGYANIFYIRDMNDVLRAVDVRWLGRGWDVDAGPLAYPLGWRAGRQVFSRKYTLLPSESQAI